MTARATHPSASDLGDPARPPGTTRGTEAVRRRRGARRAAWIATAYLVFVAAVGTALWLADRVDPQMDAMSWGMLAFTGTLVAVPLLPWAWQMRADSRAWESALTALTAGAGEEQGEPGDAILELSWNLERDVARVRWDGVTVGRWWPTRGVDPGGRSWHLAHPTEPAPGHLERDHVYGTSRHGFAELRLDHRPYLLSEYSAVLVDTDGTEWSLRNLLGSSAFRTIDTVPRALGADGAVFVLRAHQELYFDRRRRKWTE